MVGLRCELVVVIGGIDVWGMACAHVVGCIDHGPLCDCCDVRDRGIAAIAWRPREIPFLNILQAGPWCVRNTAPQEKHTTVGMSVHPLLSGIGRETLH